ncbi:MAG TPA: O-antigen ligase family protein [Gemmatimonadaceae bacterium]|nr:O-antigen ligase family protein [Gemmatimonadaceae bacterium]
MSLITLRPNAVRLTRTLRLPSTAFDRLKARAARLDLDPLRLSMAGMFMLSIGGVHLTLLFLKPLRPALSLAICAAAYAYLNPRKLNDGRALRTWPARVVCALVVLACLSIPFGLSIGQSATYLIEEYSKVVLFWFLLTIAIRHERDIWFFMWSFVLAAAFMCWNAIFVVGVTDQFGSHSARLNDAAMGMYDPNDMGVILTIAIPLVLLLTRNAGRLTKLFGLVVLIAIGWTVALSGSRGSFVGMITVFTIILFALREVSVIRRVSAILVIAGALFLAAPDGYWKQMGTMLEPSADYNLTDQDGRVKVWKRGVGYMIRYPVFGLGIANFGRAEGTISEKAKQTEDGMGLIFTAAHNSFVQVGAELGIAGLVLWSSLSVGGIFGLLSLRRRLPRDWATGTTEERFIYTATMYMPIAYIGFIVTCSFVSFAFMDPIYILTAFTAALYACADRRLAPPIPPPTTRRGARVPFRSPWLAKR